MNAMNSGTPTWMSRLATSALLLGLPFASPAQADFSWDDVAAIIAGEKWESFLDNHTAEREQEIIELAFEAYHDKLGDAAVAKAMIGGQRVSTLADGTETLLTFQFVAADTGLPVPMPDVASVLYQIQIDPPTLEPVFVDYGISTDPSSDFALPFLISGFEPLIQAIPRDGKGVPLVVIGPTGTDVAPSAAINIPIEPVPAIGTFGFAAIVVLVAAVGVCTLRRRSGSMADRRSPAFGEKAEM
jgi:hypothetical protein